MLMRISFKEDIEEFWEAYPLFVVRSDKTPYAKRNGGQFNFIFDEQGYSLPDDQVTEFFHSL